MSEHIHNVNDSEFETEVLQASASTPVVVDFWAEWCGPCKMMNPVLEEIATDYADRIKVVKVNVDESSAIAAKYGIRGIPTLVLFKQGNVAATKVGAQSKSQLSAFIDEQL